MDIEELIKKRELLRNKFVWYKEVLDELVLKMNQLSRDGNGLHREIMAHELIHGTSTMSGVPTGFLNNPTLGDEK